MDWLWWPLFEIEGMLTRIWAELDSDWDILHVTKEAHVQHL